MHQKKINLIIITTMINFESFLLPSNVKMQLYVTVIVSIP